MTPFLFQKRGLNGNKEQRLLDAAGEKLHPVILFALETAMRRSEIASLKWVDVDFQRQVARLRHTKNGEPRSVPLTPAAYRILSDLRDDNDDDSATVFEMTTGAITQAMDDARRRSGIEDLRFHDLRHEATSRLFENTTLDIMEMAITGHKTMQKLARYTHLRTERLVEKLNGEADGKETPLAFYIEKPDNSVKHNLTRPKKYTTPRGRK